MPRRKDASQIRDAKKKSTLLTMRTSSSNAPGSLMETWGATWVSGFFALIILAAIPYQLYVTRVYEGGWRIGEWLISYAGGFVRRGLPGSLIYGLGLHFGLPPIPIIWLFSVASFVILLLICLHLCRGAASLDFLLSPAFLGAPTIAPFLVRKDMFCLACFGGCLILLGQCSLLKRYTWRTAWINAVCIVAILTHESFGFYSIPALTFAYCVRVSSQKGCYINRKIILDSTARLLPAIAIFLAVLVFKGNSEISVAIHNSWRELAGLFPRSNAFDQPVPPAGSIQDLQMSTIDGFRTVYDHVFVRFDNRINAFFAYVLTMFVVACLYLGDYNSKHARIKSLVLAIQAVGVFPLFAIAHDWGRWIFVWIGSSLMLSSFIISLPDLRETIIIPSVTTRLRLLLKFLRPIPLGTKNSWILLFVSIPGSMWSMNKFFESMPVIHFVRLVKWYSDVL